MEATPHHVVIERTATLNCGSLRRESKSGSVRMRSISSRPNIPDDIHSRSVCKAFACLPIVSVSQHEAVHFEAQAADRHRGRHRREFGTPGGSPLVIIEISPTTSCATM